MHCTGMRLVCAGETRFSTFLYAKFEDNIATVTEQITGIFIVRRE